MMGTERRGLSSRRSMTVLGKIPSVPKPINLPSQKLENKGVDPNVEIVPRGGVTWGNASAKSPPKNAWGISTSPSSSAGSALSQSGSRPATPVTPSTSSNPWTSSTTTNALPSPSSIPSSFSALHSDTSASRPTSSGGRFHSGSNESANQRPLTVSSVVDLHPVDKVLPPRPHSAESASYLGHPYSSNMLHHDRWMSSSSKNNSNQNQDERFQLSGENFPTLSSVKEKERPKSADQKHSNINSNYFGDDIPPPTAYVSTPGGGTAETWKKENSPGSNPSYDSLRPGNVLPMQPPHNATWQRDRWQQEPPPYRPMGPQGDSWQREINPQNPPFSDSWNGPGHVSVNPQADTWRRDMPAQHASPVRPPFDTWQKDPMHAPYPSFPQGMRPGLHFPGNFPESPIMPGHSHGFRPPPTQQGGMFPMNGGPGSFPNRRRNNFERNQRDNHSLTFPSPNVQMRPDHRPDQHPDQHPDHRPEQRLDQHHMLTRPNMFGGMRPMEGFYGPSRPGFVGTGERENRFGPNVMSAGPSPFHPPSPFGWTQMNASPNFQHPPGSARTSVTERFDGFTSQVDYHAISSSTSSSSVVRSDEKMEGKEETKKQVILNENVGDESKKGGERKEEKKEKEKGEKKVKEKTFEWGTAAEEEEMDFSKPVFGKEEDYNHNQNQNHNSQVDINNEAIDKKDSNEVNKKNETEISDANHSVTDAKQSEDRRTGEVRERTNMHLTQDRNLRILKRSENSNEISHSSEPNPLVREKDSTQPDSDTGAMIDHSQPVQMQDTVLDKDQSELSKSKVNESQSDGLSKSIGPLPTGKFKASSDKDYDYEAQRARLRENAQKALQLKKAEEEKMKEQKMKAKAKLDELNRKSNMNRESQSQSQIQTEIQNQNQSQIQTETQNQSQSQIQTEIQNQNQSQIQTESQNQSQTQYQIQSQIQMQTQTQTEIQKLNHIQSQSQSQSQSYSNQTQEILIEKVESVNVALSSWDEEESEKDVKEKNVTVENKNESSTSNEEKFESADKEKEERRVRGEDVMEMEVTVDVKKETNAKVEYRGERKVSYPSNVNYKGNYRKERKDTDFRPHQYGYREYREKEKVYVEKDKMDHSEWETSQESSSPAKEKKTVNDKSFHSTSPIIDSSQGKNMHATHPSLPHYSHPHPLSHPHIPPQTQPYPHIPPQTQPYPHIPPQTQPYPHIPPQTQPYPHIPPQTQPHTHTQTHPHHHSHSQVQPLPYPNPNMNSNNEFKQRMNVGPRYVQKHSAVKKVVSVSQLTVTESKSVESTNVQRDPIGQNQSQSQSQNQSASEKVIEQHESKNIVHRSTAVKTESQYLPSSASFSSSSLSSPLSSSSSSTQVVSKSSTSSQNVSFSSSSIVSSSPSPSPSFPVQEFMSFGQFIVPKPTEATTLSIHLTSSQRQSQQKKPSQHPNQQSQPSQTPSIPYSALPKPYPNPSSEKDKTSAHRVKDSDRQQRSKVNSHNDTHNDAKSKSVSSSGTVSDSGSGSGLRSGTISGSGSGSGSGSVFVDSDPQLKVARGAGNAELQGRGSVDRATVSSFSESESKSMDAQKTNPSHHSKHHTGGPHDKNNEEHAEIMNNLWKLSRGGRKNQTQNEVKKNSNSIKNDNSVAKSPSNPIHVSKETDKNDHDNQKVKEVSSEKTKAFEPELDLVKDSVLSEREQTNGQMNRQTRKFPYSQSNSSHAKVQQGQYQHHLAHQSQSQHQSQYQYQGQHQSQYHHRQSYPPHRHVPHEHGNDNRQVAASHSSNYVREDKGDVRSQDSPSVHASYHSQYGVSPSVGYRGAGEGSMGRGRGRGKQWERKTHKPDSAAQSSETHVSNASENTFGKSFEARSEPAVMVQDVRLETTAASNQTSSQRFPSTEGKYRPSDDQYLLSKSDRSDQSKSADSAVNSNERERGKEGGRDYGGNSFGRGRGGYSNNYYNKNSTNQKQTRRGMGYDNNSNNQNDNANFTMKESFHSQNHHKQNQG